MGVSERDAAPARTAHGARTDLPTARDMRRAADCATDRRVKGRGARTSRETSGTDARCTSRPSRGSGMRPRDERAVSLQVVVLHRLRDACVRELGAELVEPRPERAQPPVRRRRRAAGPARASSRTATVIASGRDRARRLRDGLRRGPSPRAAAPRSAKARRATASDRCRHRLEPLRPRGAADGGRRR
jgi:hypothetical protein